MKTIKIFSLIIVVLLIVILIPTGLFLLDFVTLKHMDVPQLVQTYQKYQNISQSTKGHILLRPVNLASSFIGFYTKAHLGIKMRDNESRAKILSDIKPVLQNETDPEILESYVEDFHILVHYEIKDVLDIPPTALCVSNNREKTFIEAWGEKEVTIYDFPNSKKVISILDVLISKQNLTQESRKSLECIIDQAKELPTSMKEPVEHFLSGDLD